MRRSVLLVTVLLVAGGLAGCATPEEPGTGDGDGQGPGTGQMTTQEAIAAYRGAMTTFQEGPEGTTPGRISFDMEVQALEAEAGMSSSFLLDPEATLAIMQMEMTGEAAMSDEGGMGMSAFMGEEGGSMVFATYHKTSFFGSPQGLFGIYNESAEPVEDWRDFQSSQSGPDDVGGMAMGPSAFLSDVDEIPEDADVTHETTTFQGTPAVRLTVSYENKTSTVEMTALIYTQPPAEGVPVPTPARIEATIREPAATDPLDRASTMTMTFTYDQAASHELEDGIQRLEAMTFLSEGSMGMAGMGGGFGDPQADQQERNWTIQPSKAPGTVALAEAELWVEAEDPEGQTERVITMPLEEGTATAGNVTVTFEDVDEDGAISPGDRIVLQQAGNGSMQYTIQLHDEVSGLVLVPGPGALLALGLLGLAALVARGWRG